MMRKDCISRIFFKKNLSRRFTKRQRKQFSRTCRASDDEFTHPKLNLSQFWLFTPSPSSFSSSSSPPLPSIPLRQCRNELERYCAIKRGVEKKIKIKNLFLNFRKFQEFWTERNEKAMPRSFRRKSCCQISRYWNWSRQDDRNLFY